MAKFRSELDNLPPMDKLDISLEMYIRKYYIDTSADHPTKYPRVILEHLGFMAEQRPIQFWSWLLEQPKQDEYKHMKGQRLVWGYADRIALCAALFVQLPDEDQQYILKARHQKPPIWWRGDNMTFFKKLAKETYLYNQLSDEAKREYKKTVLARAMGKSRNIRPSSSSPT